MGSPHIFQTCDGSDPLGVYVPVVRADTAEKAAKLAKQYLDKWWGKGYEGNPENLPTPRRGWFAKVRAEDMMRDEGFAWQLEEFDAPVDPSKSSARECWEFNLI